MAGERTERATPKRRQEARNRGQVVRSPDVATTIVLGATLAALSLLGPRMVADLAATLRDGLQQTANPGQVSPTGLGRIERSALSALLHAGAPFVLVSLVAGVLANVIQVRPKLTTAALKPNGSRLNPINGAKRLFGPQGLVEGLKATAKILAVGATVFTVVRPKLRGVAGLVGVPPQALMSETARQVRSLALVAIAAMAVIAVADWFWQRHTFEKSLKMSKDDVKQESRQQDMAPEVKGAIKRKQFEQARRRMLADVATADVVVTNPTHFAVALRYDGSQPAPEVVAKGADLVAAAIREAAREHGVTIVEDPPLARSLYRSVELGQQIPAELFTAVAEVLAYVYRRSGRLRALAGGRRSTS